MTTEYTQYPEYPDLIRPGSESEGEAGYWIVTIPAQVWSTDEVRDLAHLIPNILMSTELLQAIGDEPS